MKFKNFNVFHLEPSILAYIERRRRRRRRRRRGRGGGGERASEYTAGRGTR